MAALLLQCTSSFDLPAEISRTLLPDPQLSVATFIRLKLPVMSTATLLIPLAKFFSPAKPTVTDLEEIRNLPLPSHTVMAKLIQEIKAPAAFGAKSVTCPHIFGNAERYPIWIILYWNEIATCWKIRTKWAHAETWVERTTARLKNHTDRALGIKVLRTFSLLKWSGTLNGFTWDVPLVDLTEYLGNNWLSNYEVDQMLHGIIHRSSCSIDVREGYQGQEISFGNKLQATYRARVNLLQAQSTLFARLGNELAEGQCLVAFGFLHVRNNHWVAWAFDSRTWTLHYGDPQGVPIEDETVAMFKWWLSQYSQKSMVVKTLTITIQDDNHSCGVLSANALEHFICPEVPLVSPSRVQTLRYHAFLTACHRHLEMEPLPAEPESLNPETEPSFDSVTTLIKDDDDSINLSVYPAGISSESDSEEFILSDIETYSDDAGSLYSESESMGMTEAQSIVRQKRSSDSLTSSPEAKQPLKKCLKALEVSSTKPRNVLYQPLTKTKQPPISSFFISFKTREETLQHMTQRAGKEADIQSEFRDQCHQVQRDRTMERMERVKSLARLRQQKRRALLKAEWRLVPESFNISELSRPRREFVEDTRSIKGSSQSCKIHKAACRTNWLNPLLWPHIEAAGRDCLPKMSQADIVRVLKLRVPLFFNKLFPQTVRKWIDRTGPTVHWKESVLKKAKKGTKPGGESTHLGLLAIYPETVKKIITQLKSLRELGVPLSVITVRAVMIGYLQVDAPEIFSVEFKNGTRFNFRCTDSYVRRFLRETLEWSERRATRAAQKTPCNWEDVCFELNLRLAATIKAEDIVAGLIVNSDQTGIIYSQGANMSWAPKGSKQVAVIGQEEKRAFTMLVSVCADGQMLPFQAIYRGKSSISCPNSTSPMYKEAMEAGFKFVPSKSDNHWSTLDNMKLFVTSILVPFFTAQKEKLGLAKDHKAVWIIDCWSVHRSAEFRGWLKTMHPNIIILYIPANCTGVFQPCDVGIQRPLKLILKRCAHEDIVAEVSAALEAPDSEMDRVKLQTSISVFRNRSTRWMFEAYSRLNNPDVVLNAFKNCRAKGFNLSFESLTSNEMKKNVRELRTTHPHLYDELEAVQTGKSELVPVGVIGTCNEDDHDYSPFDDDSNLPLDAVLAKISGKEDPRVIEDDEGNLVYCTAPLETSEVLPVIEEEENEEEVMVGDESDEVLGRGKRKRKPSNRYANQFWMKH